MRRASHKRNVPPHAASARTPENSAAIGVAAHQEFSSGSKSASDSDGSAAAFRLAPGAAFSTGTTNERRELPEPIADVELAIRQRIESRLPGRVRNLNVQLIGDTVLLEGQCATYYTKQLAQHAALGILEDEHLENAIVVCVPR